MGLWVYVASAVLAVALGFGSGWKTHAWKTDSAELERVKTEAQRQADTRKLMERAAEAFEDGKSSVAAREVVVEKEVRRVISKVEYRNVCLDDDGLRIMSDDAAFYNSRRGFAPAVPSDPAASGPVKGKPAPLE